MSSALSSCNPGAHRGVDDDRRRGDRKQDRPEQEQLGCVSAQHLQNARDHGGAEQHPDGQLTPLRGEEPADDRPRGEHRRERSVGQRARPGAQQQHRRRLEEDRQPYGRGRVGRLEHEPVESGTCIQVPVDETRSADAHSR
jgi:hypothetical protein